MADRNGYIGRAPSDSAVIVARQTFSPTGVTTNFTFASGYSIGYVDAYLNGARLIEGQDYTATDGSVVSLVSSATSGDILELVAYKAFNVGNVTNATGDFTVGGKLTVVGVTSASSANYTGNVTVGTGINIVGGGLTVTGISTFYNNINLGDNKKAQFGDSNDLQIYHDGSDSYILDNGTGRLRLASQGTSVDIIKDDGENLARFVTDGAAELYYDASKKLETTSTGINVTGIATASGGFNLGISSAGTVITSGPVKTLNFVGTGNTFTVNGTTVDISIQGGGGGGGAELDITASLFL